MTEAERDDASLDAPSFEEVGAVAVEAATKTVLDRIAWYMKKGATISQAVDMYATEDADIPAKTWANETDRQAQTVRSSKSKGIKRVYS
jgi:hypothetical protein